MNEMQVFNNPEFGSVRTLLIDGEPWAVGKDIASGLGYAKPTDAVRKHVDDEDRGISKTETPSGVQDAVIINESGIYSLILSSKLPSAKRFKHWVTSEILPSIRKTGKYEVETVPDAPRVLTADDYLTAARILSGCRNERLPYVLPLIRKAGIEIDITVKPSQQSGKDPATARLLNTAFNDYGVSIRELERRTGIHNAQLYRMRNGTSRYNAARAAIIRDAVHALVPELDMAEYEDNAE